MKYILLSVAFHFSWSCITIPVARCRNTFNFQSLRFEGIAPSNYYTKVSFQTCRLRKGTFFLGGGRAGEFWYFCSQKSVGPPLHFNKKTSDPPPLGDWQKCDSPLTTAWYVPCCRKLRTFRLWTQSVWIWIYLDIECVRAETRKPEQTVWDIYVL